MRYKIEICDEDELNLFADNGWEVKHAEFQGKGAKVKVLLEKSSYTTVPATWQGPMQLSLKDSVNCRLNGHAVTLDEFVEHMHERMDDIPFDTDDKSVDNVLEGRRPEDDGAEEKQEADRCDEEIDLENAEEALDDEVARIIKEVEEKISV